MRSASARHGCVGCERGHVVHADQACAADPLRASRLRVVEARRRCRRLQGDREPHAGVYAGRGRGPRAAHDCETQCRGAHRLDHRGHGPRHGARSSRGPGGSELLRGRRLRECQPNGRLLPRPAARGRSRRARAHAGPRDRARGHRRDRAYARRSVACRACAAGDGGVGEDDERADRRALADSSAREYGVGH